MLPLKTLVSWSVSRSLSYAVPIFHWFVYPARFICSDYFYFNVLYVDGSMIFCA